jgi:hypothetical protein
MSISIAGISETGATLGTINTSAVVGATIKLAKSPATNSIWTRPYLQMIGSGGGFVSLRIANVVTAQGTLPGPFTPGKFAQNVSQFDVQFDTNDEVARAVITTVFFG